MNNRLIQKRKLLLLIGDLVVIFVSINFAFMVRFGSLPPEEKFNKYLYIWGVLSLVYVFSFYVFGQYNIKTRFSSSKNIILYSGSLALAILIITAIFFVFPFNIGRGLFFFSLVFTFVFCFVWRNIYSSVFRLAFPKRNVLLINGEEKERELYDLLKGSQDYRIKGILSDKPLGNNPDFPYLGKTDQIEEVIDKHRITDIITTLEPTSSHKLLHGLVTSKVRGIQIYDYPTFYEGLNEKIPVLKIEEKWLFYSSGFERLGGRLYKRFKRTLDFLISFLILLVSLPFGLLIALFIKIDSQGPVFYTQERLGKNERPFRLIKFRTMVKNAEKHEPKWAEENDTRITRVGRVVRKMRLDELPQLINIFRGDMSLIGPRPERQFFIGKLKKSIPFYSLRFSVRPGLTGWAQVNYSYGSSVKDAVEKLEYDLYYIKNMSLFLDLRIILRTIRIILFGMGR